MDRHYDTHTGLALDLHHEQIDEMYNYTVTLTGDKVKTLYDGPNQDRAIEIYEAEVTHYEQRKVDEA